MKFDLNKKETLTFDSKNPHIKHKTGLLNLTEELGNISQACKARYFYRYQQALEQIEEAFYLVRLHNLANFKQRLNALEKDVAEKGIILVESQFQALERKKDDDITYGEIETPHTGYLLTRYL